MPVPIKVLMIRLLLLAVVRDLVNVARSVYAGSAWPGRCANVTTFMSSVIWPEA
jgi:hypothetical protein